MGANPLGKADAATGGTLNQGSRRELATLRQCCFKMLPNVTRLSTRECLCEVHFEALSGGCTVTSGWLLGHLSHPIGLDKVRESGEILESRVVKNPMENRYSAGVPSIASTASTSPLMSSP